MSSESALYAVITTIQPPTDAVIELSRRLREVTGRLVVAGDLKGPAVFDLADCEFLSLATQSTVEFRLAKSLPQGHYARKNIAYLRAVQCGAQCIYETDDDNAPLASWQARTEHVCNARAISGSVGTRWVNVYRHFTDDHAIWPRGFPLERLADRTPICDPVSGSERSPIQQGLVNGSPDVDAVWRLTQDRPFAFDVRPSLRLGPGNWCPFNTQSTWWWPVAYPLLYIPSFCSFRMCDIWKSFVAQRCLWAMGLGVVFHAAEVHQDRNPHNALKDFESEVPGYLQNAKMAVTLDALRLDTEVESVSQNLRTCYAALVAEGFLPAREMDLVEAWLEDIALLRKESL